MAVIRRPTFFHCMAIAMALCFFLPAPGCGGSDDRLPLAGEVTLDGKPLAEGAITFSPLNGPYSAGGVIRDGKFDIPRSGGPRPGKYRVAIVSYQSTGKRLPDPDRPGETVEEQKQIIPPKYNRESTLEVEIPGGSLQFALESS